MYSGTHAGGVMPSFGTLLGAGHTAAAVTTGGEDGPYYAQRADFFFQVVFVGFRCKLTSDYQGVTLTR